MDIWRISLSTSNAAATPERITSHHAWVAYPAWLDARTLIYAATADDGSGQWLYALDVEHRIPHRVSSGIAEQYQSVAVSNTRPRRVIAAVATPTASLWTVPISDRRPERGGGRRAYEPRTAAPAALASLQDIWPFFPPREAETDCGSARTTWTRNCGEETTAVSWLRRPSQLMVS